jgi:hypothetical protein
MNASFANPDDPSTAPLPWAHVLVAAGAAVVAQGAFVALFVVAPRGAAGRAEIAEARRDEIAVAVEPVDDRPLLKYGAEEPARAPAGKAAPRWRGRQASASPAAAAQASPPLGPVAPTPAPSAPADAPDPSPAPIASASASAPAPSTGDAADAGPPAAATTPGSALGSDAGTEVDPLKARIVASYRAQLDAWFSARFHIRGKLPFGQLEKLAASVVVEVSDARRVVGFSIASPSGDPIFDGQLRADLAAIQASGVELPAPPPAHPELLERSVHLRFACAIRAACE